MSQSVMSRIDSASEESSNDNDDHESSSEGEYLYEQSDETKDEMGQSSAIASDIHGKGDRNNSDGAKHNYLTFVCSALSDYTAKEAGEISFEKGDILTIINIRKDGWWEATNSDGIQGLVPSTFLKVSDHVNALINEKMQSNDSKEIHFWSNLRSSIRKAHALNTAIQTFGSIGLPLGFRECMLGSLLKEDKNYRTEAFLKPKLSDSGLSFEDMHWENCPISDNKMALQLKPITTVLQKVIQLVALRQVIPPPSDYEVTSRHVHMCLHDGNKVLSNIHTTKASWDAKNPKIWMFDTKGASDSLCAEEGQIFIRSNKSFATLGILFELCVSYRKKELSEISEMSCGWAFKRLLDDSGLPVKSRTKILKIHSSVPFTNYTDGTSSSLSSLQKLMYRNKQTRMVVSISNPKRKSLQQICYLPSTIIGPVSTIPLMALYRKVISDDLLQGTSLDSADLIQSPFLANFPQVLNEPDLTDFFHNAWSERLKQDKRHEMRSENKKLKGFCSLFMETAFLLMNTCSLPSYCLGNILNEQERKMKLAKVQSIVNGKQEIYALSADVDFKPISVQLLSAYIN